MQFCYLNIVSVLPMERNAYPNDFVCIAESGQTFLSDFKEEFGGEGKKFPWVYVSNGMTEERIGIALTDYNRLFGESETLEKEEIIGIYTSSGTSSMVYSQKDQTTAFLHLGKEVDRISEEEQVYRVKYEKEKDLLGFQLVGLVVLPDAVFEEAAEKDNFHSSVMILNVKEEKLSRATEFVEDRLEKGELDGAFCKETALKADRQEAVLVLAITCAAGIGILFFMLFIQWLKLFGETEALEEKYGFLNITGMEQKTVRKTLSREVSIPVWISMLVSAILTGLM